MRGSMVGKTALVTGGGGGIGTATALAFASEGARVAVADINYQSATETASSINALGGEAIPVRCDISDRAQVKNLISEVVRAFGAVDYAFNNAGVNSVCLGMAGKKLVDWPEDAFEKMIQINLTSVFLCMKYQISQMLTQGGGVIVNTSSIAGLVGFVGGVGYTAAKHGVIGLSRNAALEYADQNIRVNAICPGHIATEMSNSTIRERGDIYTAIIPMGRRGTVEEIASLVTFLCSDRSSYITGAALPVDGGWTVQ